MRVLNLYAGIGGNRKLWDNVDVTSVESNPNIASIYQELYPKDQIIINDAHEYLKDNYHNYDFIWSSPPCPSHSQYRHNIGVKAKGYKAIYPDMKLYEEIIFLKHHYKGKWVVENTVSYYDPLIKPQKISRHYFWSNMELTPIHILPTGIRSKNKICELEQTIGIDLTKFKVPNKRQILRNCVNSELGSYIMNHAKLKGNINDN